MLVDKGFVSKSGETPYTGDTTVFNPEGWGHDLDAWLSQVSTDGRSPQRPALDGDRLPRLLRPLPRPEGTGAWEFLEEDGEPVRLDHPLTQIELPDQDKFPPLVSQVVHWLPGFPDTPSANRSCRGWREDRGQVRGHRAAAAGRT